MQYKEGWGEGRGDGRDGEEGGCKARNRQMDTDTRMDVHSCGGVAKKGRGEGGRKEGVEEREKGGRAEEEW